MWFDREESEQESLEKDLGESLSALAAKLEKKIAQTRRDGSWSRLIFVESWHSAQLHRAKTSDLREVERLFGHQGLAGVIFAEHHWDMSIMRHTWKLRVLSAPAIPDTTREFFEHRNLST